MSRLRVAFALALAPLALVACSGNDGGSTAAVTDTTTPGQPVPPLPADVVPVEFFLGDLAALGNMKLIVDEVRGQGDRVEVDLGIENGALEPVQLNRSSLLLYADDGQSSTVVDDTAPGLFDVPLASGELRRDTVVFDWPLASTPVALLLDGASYGPRVQSALVILAERPDLGDGDP